MKNILKIILLMCLIDIVTGQITTTTTITLVYPMQETSLNCSITGLEYLYLGDVVHPVVCDGYNIMGFWWFGFVALIPMVMSYLKTQSIAIPSMIALAVGGVFIGFLPVALIKSGSLMFGLGLAGLLYTAFK